MYKSPTEVFVHVAVGQAAVAEAYQNLAALFPFPCHLGSQADRDQGLALVGASVHLEVG